MVNKSGRNETDNIENSLREDASSKYRELFDFAPVAYFTLNHEGIIEDVNLAGATLLGMPRSKLLG